MPNEPITPADVEELEYLIEITKSRGWKVFKNLLYKHYLYCIEQVHKNLENHEDREAGEWLARSKEPNKIQTLIHARIKEISDKREKENET